MPFSTEVIFHNASRSEAVEHFVRDRADKLNRFHHNILSCQVVIDAPHHHHQKGNHYRVRLSLSVPGKDLVVGHGNRGSAAHEDLYVAIADAFAALESQVKTFVGKQRVMTLPHRRFSTGDVEPAPLDSDSEWERYGIEYKNWVETHGASESTIG